MPKILNIVETPYRGTLEEQDDTILWLTHALKNAGADISLLLRASAVNYALKDQDASGLAFGEIRMAHPPEIDKDLDKMIQKGVTVYVVSEDAKELGLSDDDLIGGVERISRDDLPELLDRYDQVWHW